MLSRQTAAQANRHLRLQTIVRLRWIAIAGQIATVVGTHYGLGFDLPIGICLAVIALSAWLNVFLQLRYPARHRLRNGFGSLLLGYDILQLGALLFMTGGVQNPFSILIIVPVTVAAASLPIGNLALLAALTLGVAGLLTSYFLPLPWFPGAAFELPLLYRWGTWASIFCGVLFMGLYVRRLTRESRQMSDALAATEHVLAREQKLHALDGLAAAAAHELGTPLSTIVVVSKELQREFPPDSPHHEDLVLLSSQAKRCREILARLSAETSQEDPLHTRLNLTHMLQEVAEPFRAFDKEIEIRAAPVPGTVGREPVTARNPGVMHGLTNLVENAVDFAYSKVQIDIAWTGESVRIRITDDGPGVAPALLGALGEPYLTTRPRRKGGVDETAGMGLGFFIAKTLLERSGAEVSLSNREPPATGAVVDIVWQRVAFEIEEPQLDEVLAAARVSEGPVSSSAS